MHLVLKFKISLVFVMLMCVCSFSAKAQNVGVGNTSPDEKLHVTGKVKIEHALVVKPVSKTAAATVTITSDDGFVVINHASGTQAIAITMTGTPTDGQILTIRNDDTDDAATFSSVSIAAGTTLQFTYTSSTWKPVDSPDLGSTGSAITDADADTKIQVEESADEDIIRFDIAGTEKWVMKGSRLEPVNTGNSTFIGFEAGIDDDLTDNRNTAFGYRALYSNTTGFSNTANGFMALSSNTTGWYNVANGRSLTSNTTGDANVSSGFQSLQANTTGAFNVASGFQSLFSNTTGLYNLANGSQALFSNTTGSRNVAIGYQAGYYETGSGKLYIDNSNTTKPLIYGEFNNDLLRVNGTLNINNEFSFPTADGTSGQVLETDGSGSLTWATPSSSATTYITDADADTKIQVEESADEDIIRFDIAGTETWVFNANGIANNGSSNLAIGTDALEKITTGTNNVAFGDYSLVDVTSGHRNVAIGYGAGHDISTGGFNVFIGNLAGATATGSNKLYIDNSNTTTPLIYGDFSTDLLRVNGTLNINDEFSFPTTDGTSGQVLETDGSGSLTWTTASAGSDDQTVDVFSLSGSTLSLSLEDDAASNYTVNLSSINTDTDNQTVDVFSLSGSTLSLSLEDDAASNYTVNLSSIDTDTDNQTVDVFSLSGSTLSLSLEDDAASNYTVNLSSIDTDTDNQTIDVFSLSGTTLSLSLEDDGASNSTVDLSSITGTQTLIADADTDTKIQVEESADEDLIRFDIAGTEKWRMKGSRLEPANTGKSTFIGQDAGLNDDLTSNFNTALGYRSLYTNTTGVRNVALGYQAGYSETGSDKLYIANSNTTSPLIYGDFSTNLLEINGDLLPGTDNARKLGATGNRWKEVYSTNGTIQTSDVRFKQNIESLNYGLSDLMKLRSVSYQWRSDTLGETKLGFIAQELELIVPEVVSIGTDSMQTRGVNYAELIPVLVKAIQEQQAIIESQEAENKDQEGRLQSLEAKLDILLNNQTVSK